MRSEEANNGRLHALLARLVLSADDGAQSGARRLSSPVLVLLSLALVMLVVCLAAAVLLMYRSNGQMDVLLGVLAGFPLIASGIMVVVIHRVRRDMLLPLMQLRTWALSMCNGDLSARIAVPDKGEFGQLAYHINRLSDALDKLANEMDELVRRQTDGLKQKNRSLEILYEIAAAMSAFPDLNSLLDQSTKRLMPVVDAEAATVRLRAEDGHMRLIRHLGFDSQRAASESAFVVEGNAFSEMEALLERESIPGDVEIESSSDDRNSMGLVTIPLRYRSKNLGVCTLLTRSPQLAEEEEVRQLLLSVGKHLGMAIEKERLDKEGRNLSIMRERTSLAHELHDSLAQTLVSLRFQVKMLSETIADSAAGCGKHEVECIQSSLDEAHTELRELIANFRGPVDQRGLFPALKELVARFRSETGIATYLQTDCPEPALSAASEMQVLRIVGEALANVRKHSEAHTVRVLMRCEEGASHSVLIEDDGKGIRPPVVERRPGEQVGLSIMYERARRLAGELRIESEPGEGTRILLVFPAPSAPGETLGSARAG